MTLTKLFAQWRLALALLLAFSSLWLLCGCAGLDGAKMITALAGDTNQVHLRIQTIYGGAELWRNVPAPTPGIAPQ